jgi:hypothetical protein
MNANEVVTGSVASNGVARGRGEVDADAVAADIVACEGVVVAGIVEADADKVVVAYCVV